MTISIFKIGMDIHNPIKGRNYCLTNKLDSEPDIFSFRETVGELNYFEKINGDSDKTILYVTGVDVPIYPIEVSQYDLSGRDYPFLLGLGVCIAFQNNNELFRVLADLGYKIPGNPEAYAGDFMVLTADGVSFMDWKDFIERNTFLVLPKDILKLKDSRKVLPYFKPFERVLVRNSVADSWKIDFFQYKQEDVNVCIGGSWKICIPFIDSTRHLLASTTRSVYIEQ